MPDVEVEAADILTLMYTSGTTGLPKGIPHTHFIRAMYATTMANAWRMTPESVVLHTGAIVFNGAMVTLLPAFLCGARYVLHRAFDAEAFIAAVEAERVTHTMLVPAQIIAILNARGFDPARLASLQMILSLGAPLHREHKDRLNRLLPDRFHELYGLTEGFVTILDRADALRKTGSVGVPPPFYEIRIVEPDGRDAPRGAVGEIVGRGPITMAGYFNRPDATAQALVNGWLHTGDLGYLDEDGYLYLVDRMKDMIDSGGVKVYPKDIEEIVSEGHRGDRRHASRGARGRRVRHSRRQVGRDAGRGDRPQCARQRHGRRDPRVGECARRRQVPAARPRRRHGRIPAQCRRQDAEARAARAVLEGQGLRALTALDAIAPSNLPCRTEVHLWPANPRKPVARPFSMR